MPESLPAGESPASLGGRYLSNGLEINTAFVADKQGYRQFQKDLRLRKIGSYFVKDTLLLSCMGFDSKGVFRWLSSFVVLLFFGFIEQPDLVFTENIGGLFNGLIKPSSLGIGKQLVHMVQLSFQLANLCLLCLDLALMALDCILQNSYFGSNICRILI
jgi:hypothetical protein